jgi:hypothetical protein
MIRGSLFTFMLILMACISVLTNAYEEDSLSGARLAADGRRTEIANLKIEVKKLQESIAALQLGKGDILVYIACI